MEVWLDLVGMKYAFVAILEPSSKARKREDGDDALGFCVAGPRFSDDVLLMLLVLS